MQNLMKNARSDVRIHRKSLFLVADLAEQQKEIGGVLAKYTPSKGYLMSVVSLVVAEDLDTQEKVKKKFRKKPLCCMIVLYIFTKFSLRQSHLFCKILSQYSVSKTNPIVFSRFLSLISLSQYCFSSTSAKKEKKGDLKCFVVTLKLQALMAIHSLSSSSRKIHNMLRHECGVISALQKLHLQLDKLLKADDQLDFVIDLQSRCRDVMIMFSED